MNERERAYETALKLKEADYELLVDKTDNLNQQSIRFKKHSTQLKQAMWWQNAKLMIFVGAVVVVVIGIIAYSMKK